MLQLLQGGFRETSHAEFCPPLSTSCFILSPQERVWILQLQQNGLTLMTEASDVRRLVPWPWSDQVSLCLHRRECGFCNCCRMGWEKPAITASSSDALSTSCSCVMPTPRSLIIRHGWVVVRFCYRHVLRDSVLRLFLCKSQVNFVHFSICIELASVYRFSVLVLYTRP